MGRNSTMNEGFRSQEVRFSIETRLTSHLNIGNHFDTFSKVAEHCELLQGFIQTLRKRANIKVVSKPFKKIILYYVI